MPVASLIALATLVLGRAVDLLGTWLASPDLRLEGNAWMRRLGWRGSLLANAGVIVGLALLTDMHTWIWIGVFSALLGVRNAQLAWIARALGSERYREALGSWMRQASRRLLVTALLLESLTFVVLGLALTDGTALRDHPRLWYIADAGRGILFYGLFMGLFRGFEAFNTRRAVRDPS